MRIRKKLKLVSYIVVGKQGERKDNGVLYGGSMVARRINQVGMISEKRSRVDILDRKPSPKAYRC